MLGPQTSWQAGDDHIRIRQGRCLSKKMLHRAWNKVVQAGDGFHPGKSVTAHST